jgi:putative peptidoglycan lipid II flippase
LARPIVSMLFERGEFTAEVAKMTAWALVWYAAGLVGHSIMEVLTRAFYAQQDTKTPVIIGAIAMGLNVVFSITFSKLFTQIGWIPVGGLALANSLATALEAAALFIFMRKRLNGIEGKSIWDGAWRVGLAGLGMAIGLSLLIQLSGSWMRWIVALGGIAIGAVVYFAGVVILKVPEIRMIINSIMRRLGRGPTASSL